MSASFARPSPTKQAIVDSLMFTSPPTLEQLHDRLSRASSCAAWTAWAVKPGTHAECIEPSDEILEEAESDLLLAYLAVYAKRGARSS